MKTGKKTALMFSLVGWVLIIGSVFGLFIDYPLIKHQEWYVWLFVMCVGALLVKKGGDPLTSIAVDGLKSLKNKL